MKERAKRIHRKVAISAEKTYRKNKEEGAIIILSLPRKKPDISKLVLYKPLIVLENWS